VNLLLMNDGARCLIFVERRVDASELATRLSSDGFPVQSFSGELAQAQRTRTLAAFRDGTVKMLVSTDVAARGIDVPDIELVIHADPPENADAYVHRSGRTGRAGRSGRSVLLTPPRGRRQIERLLAQARIKVEWTPAPAAAKVAKLLRKGFRQEVHVRLASDEGPTQRHVDYAKGLLDGHDPAVVVALLLDMAQPSPARAPLEIREARQERSSAGSPTSEQGFVRFKVNWGERQGAAANRLLGHICRRGEIRSHLVGAIKIGTDESTFEVDGSVAARFEKLAQRPDRRDPKLRIVRSHEQQGVRGRAQRDRRPSASRKPRVDRKSGGRSKA
jgi:ATP-dependent RNA helicase DeaD